VARFWDTSAVIPLVVHELETTRVLALLQNDQSMIVWWGTQLESVSALARGVREGGLTTTDETHARTALGLLIGSWSEIQPTQRVRAIAERLLRAHSLRAADALQLASALVWSDGVPERQEFVCLDVRLREAAHKEGFLVQPSDSALPPSDPYRGSPGPQDLSPKECAGSQEAHEYHWW